MVWRQIRRRPLKNPKPKCNFKGLQSLSNQRRDCNPTVTPCPPFSPQYTYKYSPGQQSLYRTKGFQIVGRRRRCQPHLNEWRRNGSHRSKTNNKYDDEDGVEEEDEDENEDEDEANDGDENGFEDNINTDTTD
ncbi:GH12922 [Drosophila grimshawi]|uniref:GH12922 n=1 Tax=Drosophila grimshawi TaxID=7222 RepID=B4JIU8_DROGR|nr:GH12922 [Drosophila grimshawi]